MYDFTVICEKYGLYRKHSSSAVDIEENHALQQQEGTCSNRKSLFCLHGTRQKVLSGHRTYSRVPRADPVTRHWTPSRGSATRLSCLLPTAPLPLGSVSLLPRCTVALTLARVAYWNYGHRGYLEVSSQSRGGTLERPRVEKVSLRHNVY